MGIRPKGYTIERKNNNKGYCKNNCNWSTRATQNRNLRRNVRITYKEKSMCISEWARYLGINRQTFQNRLSRGWSLERAFTEKVSSK